MSSLEQEIALLLVILKDAQIASVSLVLSHAWTQTADLDQFYHQSVCWM